MIICAAVLVPFGSTSALAADGSGVPNLVLTLGAALICAIAFLFIYTTRLGRARDDLLAASKERKLAEEALSVAETITHIGSWDQDLATDKVIWSDETYRIFGLNPSDKETTGTTFITGVHPDDRKMVLEVWSDAVKSRGGYEIDHRVIRPDGSTRIVRERAEVICDKDLNPVRVIGTVQDITEAELTERERAASEAQFRSLAENALDVIAIIAGDGMVIYASPSVTEVLGYSIEEMQGKPIWHYAAPGERERIIKGLVNAVRAEEPGERRRPQFRFRHKDGSWRIVEVRGQRLPERDDADHVMIIARDVTGRLATETALKRQSLLLKLLGNIAIAANQATNLEEALQVGLDEVCLATGWPIGHAYVPNAEGNRLDPMGIWSTSKQGSFSVFKQVTAKTTFEPGVGLPGRVFFTGQPAWIPDVMTDGNFPRAQVADDIGVHGAFAFPALSGDRVIAVLEFFTRDVAEPDLELLEILSRVGAQLGRVAERSEAVQERQEREERFRDFAESSSDWFWETDADMKYRAFDGRNELITTIESGSQLGRDRMKVIQGVLTPEDLADSGKWDRHNADIEARKPFQDFRYSILRPDGKSLHIRVSGSPVFGPDGEFQGYRGTATDESAEYEIRKLEEYSRRTLKDAVESLEDGFALFDSEDRLVQFNSKYADMVNQTSPDSLQLGRTFEDHLREWVFSDGYIIEGGESEAFFDDRLTAHRNLPSDRVHQLGPGTWVHVKERRTSDGGTVLLQHDITEFKNIEEALRSSESRVSGIIEMAPESIIAIDEQSKIQIFNTGAELTFGYEATEVMGKHLDILLPEKFHAIHDNMIMEFSESEVHAKGMGNRPPILAKRKGGEEFPAEAAISKLETADGMLFTVMLRDISDRLLYEERLATSQAHMEDAIGSISQNLSLWDPDGKLVLYNQQFVDTIDAAGEYIKPGISYEEALLEARRRGVFGSDDEGVEAFIKARIAQFKRRDGKPSYRTQLDGRRLEIVDIQTHDGGTLTVTSDITEMTDREDALRDAMHQAELANRAKSEFLANVSHELRTPLNAILGFSEIIQTAPFGEVGDPRYVEYAGDIRDSGTHLLEIINDILDLSRIEAGQVSLHEQEVDIAETVERVETMLRARAEKENVEFRMNISPDMPHIYVDPRIFRQILANLMSNAVKFSANGGQVSVSAELASDGALQVAVEDNGIGIAPDDLPRVLEPFGQADGSMTRNFEGVGLGLPLTKSFVELHGGALFLESTPNVGTKVTVEFPGACIMKDQMPASTQRVM